MTMIEVAEEEQQLAALDVPQALAKVTIAVAALAAAVLLFR